MGRACVCEFFPLSLLVALASRVAARIRFLRALDDREPGTIPRGLSEAERAYVLADGRAGDAIDEYLAYELSKNGG